MLITSLNRPVTVAAAVLAAVLSSGCATKKHVRQQVEPVERRVTEAEAKSTKQGTAITDLERNLSATDERVKTVDAKATAAGAEAAKANEAAGRASSAADGANRAAVDAKGRADMANTKAVGVDGRVTQMQMSMDDYKEFASETVLFAFNSSKLTPEGKQVLDSVAGKVKDNKRYMVEVHGYTDKIGDATYNKALSAKRAAAVTDYLTADQKVPLYRIFDRGAGIMDSAALSGTPKEVREQSRRVDVKIFVAKLD